MILHAKGEKPEENSKKSKKKTTKALRVEQSAYFAQFLQSKLLFLFAKH